MFKRKSVGTKIIVKNPFLKNLRNNLRKIIMLCVESELKYQYKILKELRSDGFPTKDQEIQLSELSAKNRELYSIYNRSICRCPLCKSSDRDMVYLPNEKKWICTDCFNEIQENERIRRTQGFYSTSEMLEQMKKSKKDELRREL